MIDGCILRTSPAQHPWGVKIGRVCVCVSAVCNVFIYTLIHCWLFLTLNTWKHTGFLPLLFTAGWVNPTYAAAINTHWSTKYQSTAKNRPKLLQVTEWASIEGPIDSFQSHRGCLNPRLFISSLWSRKGKIWEQVPVSGDQHRPLNSILLCFCVGVA